ncbi:uncharacterized protein SCHCODRAFT_02619947 [Schizophyllum commune H4-8]|uniref:uncharacterized protein n=1 Tax=Schizophyllum commune (strain H4-8 / FGSC 9210) TaxID=578458 RepID=UPI00215E3A21|nr:uncharacterized protein SCHCODRAFT_02619947 [Schizophyllum commune H4-8]KAI5895627.1 hypothetical protein SCHCODRAFT_02619947 [Schizophyllum commune H4-8]
MVYIPLISTRKPRRDLEPRAGGGGGGGGGKGGGGGGGGGGGKGGGSSSGGKGGSSGGSSGSGSGGRSSSISAGGTSKSASTYSRGGGPVVTIPNGSPFAGRQQGGGSRDQVYGTRQYGSGYPGVTGRGVAGRNFPFYFWPLTFGGVGAVGAHHYLDDDDEYGHPDNSSRPGGQQTLGNFTSNAGNSTFRLVADNSTTTSLLEEVNDKCSGNLDSGKTSQNASTFDYNVSWAPSPGEVVQYYRASSIALMLVGYNNSAVWQDDDSKADDPLPSWVDNNLLSCLNTTIGLAAPLIDDDNGSLQMPVPSMGVFGVVIAVWFMSLL